MGVTAFERPPVIGLWSLATHRGSGGAVPRIEATAAQVGADPAAYAAVCGVPAGPTLPIGFPDLLCRGLQLAVLTAPAFPVPLLGIVHVRQQIRQHRAIARDEPLAGRVWVEGQRPARRGGEFDLHTEVRAGADVVWHGVSTILSRHLPGDGERRPPTEPAAFTPARSTAWTLPESLGRRYARVSGDANPIHQYAWSARLFGFTRPIAHGWWTLARALAELDRPPGPAEVDARFLNPLPLPSTAWFTASAPDHDGAQAFTVRTRDRAALIGTIR